MDSNPDTETEPDEEKKKKSPKDRDPGLVNRNRREESTSDENNEEKVTKKKVTKKRKGKAWRWCARPVMRSQRRQTKTLKKGKGRAQR